MEVRGWKLGGRIEGCMQLLSRKLILYHTGWYGRNFSYWSMNQYWNTFKMYRLRYRPILDNTGRTKVYRSFRPEKRNSTGTKTERKNRRNAWFEQTQCSKLPPHWHRRLDLLLPFFFFFLFLVCCPCPLLWFLLFFCRTMNIVMWYLFFCLVSYLKFLKPFYTWLALEMLKTYIFLIKDVLNGSSFYLLFSFEPHVMWCINHITSIEPYSFYFYF